MTVIIRSGFLGAVHSVRDYFVARGITAKVECGWKRRTQTVNQGTGGANRVVFTPSEDDSGAGGELGPARFPGKRNIRPAADQPVAADVVSLQDWTRTALVSVWAVDPANLADEEAQIAATETLFEWVVRAVHSAPGAFAEAKFGRVKWTVPVERSYGLELRAALSFKHPIFDEPRELVYPAGVAIARASITTDSYPGNPGDAG